MKKAPGASVVDEIQFDSLIDIDDPNCATLEETPLLEKGISAVNHIANSLTNAWHKGSRGKNGSGSFLSNLVSAKIEFVMNDEPEAAPYAKNTNAQGREVYALPIAEEAVEAVEAEAVAEAEEAKAEGVPVAEEAKAEGVPVAEEAKAEGVPVAEEAVEAMAVAEEAEAEAVAVAEEAKAEGESEQAAKAVSEQDAEAVSAHHAKKMYARGEEADAVPVSKECVTAQEDAKAKAEQAAKAEAEQDAEASAAPKAEQAAQPALSEEERKRQISEARAAAGRKHKGNQYTRRKAKAQTAADKGTAAQESVVAQKGADAQEVADLKEAPIAQQSGREASRVHEPSSARELAAAQPSAREASRVHEPSSARELAAAQPSVREGVSAHIGTNNGTNNGTKVEQKGKEGSLSLPQEERSPITPKEEYPFLFSQENGLTAGSKAADAAFGGTESNRSAFTSLPSASALTDDESFGAAKASVSVGAAEASESVGAAEASGSIGAAKASGSVDAAEASGSVDAAEASGSVDAAEASESVCFEPACSEPVEPIEVALPSSSRLDKTLAAAAREHFLTFYKQHFGNDYYWSPKDAGQMKNLINKLRFTLRNNGMTETNENILNALDALLAGINNQWVLDNFTVAIIASKYNEIVAQMKVNTSTNLKNTYATDHCPSFKRRGKGGIDSTAASLVAKLVRK